ncbi:nonstructural protein [Mudanjiang phlebovirus]|nr:nonstructural protein [Mudanjiang phlebovirus]
MNPEGVFRFPVLDWRCRVTKEKSSLMGKTRISVCSELTWSVCDRSHVLVYGVCPDSGFPLRMSQKTVAGSETTVYSYLDSGVCPSRVFSWDGPRSDVTPIRSDLDDGLAWQFCNWSINNFINNGEIEILRALSWPTGRPTLQFIKEHCFSKTYGQHCCRSTRCRIATLIFKAAQSKDGDGLGDAIITCWRKVRKEATRLGVNEQDVPGNDLIRDISLLQIERALKRVAKNHSKWREMPATGWDEPDSIMYVGVIPFYNLSQKLVMKFDARMRYDPGSRVWMRRMMKEKEPKTEEEENPEIHILNVWMLDISGHYKLFPDLVSKILDTRYEKDWPALGAP